MDDERVQFVALTKEEIAEMNREAALIGAQAASQTHEAEDKEKQDRRLHNTDLLLENYRMLKSHCEKAVYEKTTVRPQEVIEDIMSQKDDTVIVESILRSAERTAAILEHIDKMLEVYHTYCNKGSDIDKRQYKIIKALYITGTAKNIKEISKKFGVSTVTAYSDVKTAKERLSVLFFGVDGMTIF